MGKVEQLEREIQKLSAEELAEFRRWYTDFDGHAWDAQIEADARAGKLDALAGKKLSRR